jgi:hypothetical protein
VSGERFYTDFTRPSGLRKSAAIIFLKRKNHAQKGLPMFTVEQYRAKAIEYSNLTRIANGPNEVSEYQRLERSFTELADNAQWVTDNHDKTVPAAQSTVQQ